MGADGREHAWVRGAQAGRASDFEALFRAHRPLAHRAAYLVVHDAAAAEDIAQEAFLAAIRTLGRFDRRRPFAPWLHRIVVNRAIDWARARAVRHEAGGEALAAVEAPDPPPKPLSPPFVVEFEMRYKPIWTSTAVMVQSFDARNSPWPVLCSVHDSVPGAHSMIEGPATEPCCMML